MSIIDKVNKLERTANEQGKALVLPIGFYSMNRYAQLRALSDAYTALIEHF